MECFSFPQQYWEIAIMLLCGTETALKPGVKHRYFSLLKPSLILRSDILRDISYALLMV